MQSYIWQSMNHKRYIPLLEKIIVDEYSYCCFL